jgi:hypothetical protein
MMKRIPSLEWVSLLLARWLGAGKPHFIGRVVDAKTKDLVR